MTLTSILKKVPVTSSSAPVAKKVTFSADTKTQKSQIYHSEYQRQSNLDAWYPRVRCREFYGHNNMQALQRCKYCKASGQAYLPYPDLPADNNQLMQRATFTVPEQRDDFTFRYACKDCGTIYLSRKEINDHIEATHPPSPTPTVSLDFPLIFYRPLLLIWIQYLFLLFVTMI